jgi:hypothetical protein
MRLWEKRLAAESRGAKSSVGREEGLRGSLRSKGIGWEGGRLGGGGGREGIRRGALEGTELEVFAASRGRNKSLKLFL